MPLLIGALASFMAYILVSVMQWPKRDSELHIGAKVCSDSAASLEFASCA